MNYNFWMLYTHKNSSKLERFTNYEEARKAALLMANADLSSDPVFLLAPIKVFQRPLPEVLEIDVKE